MATYSPNANVLKALAQTEIELADKSKAPLVTKAYYAPDEREKASAHFARILSAIPEDFIRMNMTVEQLAKLPDGYGIAIQPIKESRLVQTMTKAKDNEPAKLVEAKQHTTVAVLVAAIPDPNTVSKHGPDGVAFVREAVIDVLMTKVLQPFRPRAKGEEPAVPFSIESFIAKERGLGGPFVAMLGELLKFIRAKQPAIGAMLPNVQTLRQMLEYRSLAEAAFPHVPQALWERSLRMLIAMATKAEPLLIGRFQSMLDNRETASMSATVSGNLDDMFAEFGASDPTSDEDDGDGEAEEGAAA